METAAPAQEELSNKVYDYAAHLLVNAKKTEEETVTELMSQGVDSKTATVIVTDLQQQIKGARKARAKKDMLYGALWCVGGIVLTVANTGFIFWGAILFGGIQVFKGLVGSMD